MAIQKAIVKRFLVFGFEQYYPSGGWSDYLDSFETAEEAEAFAKTVRNDNVEIIEIWPSPGPGESEYRSKAPYQLICVCKTTLDLPQIIGEITVCHVCGAEWKRTEEGTCLGTQRHQ